MKLLYEFYNYALADAANGISFGPILDKFPSMRIGGKKGSIAAIEYQLLVTATNNFDEANILGEGGLGRVYKAHFNDHFHAAVKKIYAGGLEAEREFEVFIYPNVVLISSYRLSIQLAD